MVENIFNGNDSEVLEDVLELVETEDNINVLDVSVTSSNILIKVGDTFKIDTDKPKEIPEIIKNIKNMAKAIAKYLIIF